MIRNHNKKILRTMLLAGAALAVAVPAQVVLAAGAQSFTIAPQDLGAAIKKFAIASGRDVAFDPTAVAGKKSHGVEGARSEESALGALLEGTGLRYTRTGNGYAVMPNPERGSSADSPVNDYDIIVTAQKREELLQNVPIAITAVTGKGLDDRKIETGGDLMRAVPNLYFTKTFSSMYNIAIRGIGTKALNSSSDPGVAVAFNNTPLVRNRLFEQEFFDIARVEVLRGPQGTLYGRNATGGVVNVIPELPKTDRFAGMIKGETGSYSTRRLSGFLNVPITDTLAIRDAASWTKRAGFDYNEFTRNRVNGRDLWSNRVSAKWTPSSNFSADVIWEHFNEDDNRARSGKALCTPDPGPTMVGDTPVPDSIRGRMSQGCLPGSLYDDAAYGVPNYNAVTPIIVLQGQGLGFMPVTGETVNFIKPGDPYAGLVQSRDPRKIATTVDPVFRSKNDVIQLNLALSLDNGIQLTSQSSYSRDRWYSSQDYNRFVSNPAFNDSQGLNNVFGDPFADPGISPGGVFDDFQLGPSDRIMSVDLNRTRSRQWSQEFRIQSSWDGPINFNLGVNYLDFKTSDDYYAFSNLFTATALLYYSTDYFTDPTLRLTKPCPVGTVDRPCIYIDRNPIGKTDDQGHNYFLSRNDVRTKSLGAFGEVYWKPADDLKITAGLRYTRDKKVQSQIPSQLLLFDDLLVGGRVNYGYPPLPDIDQKWGKMTGRLVVDWQPKVSFTDSTLVYASFSHGYKAGGANPPRVDFDPQTVQYLPLPMTYRPESVNAFELGTKNVLDGGKLTLNATAFFYDYKNYQISQVSDRITYTENLPAQSWGLEFEGAWRPTRSFQMDTNVGYLRTRLKRGASSVDPMNRTAGNDDWMVLRPWLQAPSNCIAPKNLVEKILSASSGLGSIETFKQFGLAALCPGMNGFGTFNPDKPGGLFDFSQIFGFTYDPTVDAPNDSRGFGSDVGGNPLPNSPRFTFNFGAQYTFFIDNDDWELTFRGDYYRQSKSNARIYDLPIDHLKGWDNLNLTVTLARPKSDLAFQFYVKNVFNNQPITDAFTTADDIGLPTNTFYLDPRIIGFNVSKKF